jgi:leucyl-tRNA synthetase
MACTVAYPYMNGRLHIGHGMTIVRADVASRFRKNNGEDVLFPFGFHCTGMPIYASAMKLTHGDVSVKTTLMSMGVKEKDIDLFKDPMHWVMTFPELALQDLQKLNLMADFTRSFVTTDINPYYDSFVRWQYRILMTKGLLKYETRPCIYSIKDEQPCADHDRQTGEGVKPEPYDLYHIGDSFKVIPHDTELDSVYDLPPTPGYQKDMVRVKYNNYEGLMPRIWYLSITHQSIPITLISDSSETLTPNAPTVKFPSFIKTGVTVYLPSQQVISRSGDQCIVACVPQWYIKYSNIVWKSKTKTAVQNMILHDPELRKQMNISVENMDDWCVSREYGLGTKLPNDPKFLIDSLSDSTIYMAYYTVCHLLHTDLYGKEQCVPSDDITDGFWNAVFLGRAYVGKLPQEFIETCHSQFSKYYPPKLRVSGKDLIYNHLVMSIYQHIAIFEETLIRPYCEEYLVNGYAKLNGKKMSKSTGNFITLAEATEQCRTDALRLILMESGDGLEDANIKLKEHINSCKSLDSLYSQSESIVDPVEMFTDASPGHMIYYQMIINCYYQSQEAFRLGKYREAITFGWRKCEKVVAAYKKVSNPSKDLINLGRIIAHLTMCPILGMEPKYMLPSWVEDIPSISDISSIYDFLQQILNVVGKVKSSDCIIQLQSHPKISDLVSIINDFISIHRENLTVSLVFDETPLHPNRSPYKIKPKLVSG